MTLNSGWWDRPDTLHDRRQNEAIESLQSSVLAQSSRARRQAERNRQATNRVAAEVARVEERLENLIELTDLRFRLMDHHETNRVRNELDRRLSMLSRGGHVPTEPLDDIPGYWLPPAANLVLETFAGRTDVTSFLELARERDRVRTDLFLLAAGIGFEVQTLSQRVVVGLLHQPVSPDLVDGTLAMDTAISVTWRQLWTDTAKGAFGDQARELLQRRLTPAVSDLELADELTKALSRGKTNALTDLRRLRERCEKVMATVNASPTGSPDTDAWRDTLRGLVNEGHGEEIELRLRTQRLLRRVNGNDVTNVGMWSEAGTVKSLFVNDILDDSIDDAQAVMAMRSCADAIMLSAQRLWDRTHSAPQARQIVRIEGLDIAVTAAGVEESDMKEIRRRIARKHTVPPHEVRNRGLMVAGFWALAMFFFAIWQPVLGGLATACMLAFLVPLFKSLRESRNIEGLRAAQLVSAEKRIERAQAQFVKTGQTRAETSNEAAAERDALQRLLGPYSRAG